MKNAILSKLKEIESANNVTVLFAAESGSRAWGFASPDSDYDARFIYVHRKNHYMSIDEPRDTIELPINDVLDINGWELRKALRLLAKSNATLFEWIQSPIVYHEDESFRNDISNVMSLFFNPRAMFNHYLSMSKSAMEVNDGEIKLKKYFYVLRTLLSCQWIVDRNEVPPIEFSKLRVLLDGNVNSLIDELLELKDRSNESFTIKPVKEIEKWIDDKRVIFENQRPGEILVSNNREVLSEFFRQYVK